MTQCQDEFRNQCKSWVKVKVVGEVNIWNLWIRGPKEIKLRSKIFISPWKCIFCLENTYFTVEIYILNCSTLALSATN